MEKTDIRKELENARKLSSEMRSGKRKPDIDTYWEVVCGDVLLAEENLKKMERQWEIAVLAREMIEYATILEGYDHMLNSIYNAVSRMLKALSGHPRLRVSLLRLQYLIVSRLASMTGHEINLCEHIEEDIRFYSRNIEAADEGRMEDIVPEGCLKTDPVEWTAGWEEVIDEADRKACEALKDVPRGMGFCHAYWIELGNVLERDYGISWQSPASMNPETMFD